MPDLLPPRDAQLAEIQRRLRLRKVAARLHRTRGGETVIRSARQVLAWGSAVRPLGARATRLLGQTSRLSIPAREVVRVSQAVQRSGTGCWLGGGWGVDALLGWQSRTHHDLDLIVSDFDRDEPVVGAALATLGYRRVRFKPGSVWWNARADYQHPTGHQIEVLGIKWGMVREAAHFSSEAGAELSDAAIRDRCFSTGSVAGVDVPCLSREFQMLVHWGYVQRHGDRHDRRFLTRSEGGGTGAHALDGDHGTTTLLVPLFLEGETEVVWRALNPGTTLPPHVTLLFPFRRAADLDAETLSRIREICRSQPAFDVELAESALFPGNVAYLRPHPDGPFKELTEKLVDAFPDCPPYEGKYDSVIPHLTVTEAGGGGEAHARRAQARIDQTLPVATRVTHVWLMSNRNSDRGWDIAEAFPLG